MMYDISVPVIIHFLKGLSRILQKAEDHCQAKKIAPEALLQARLFPDMFAFTKQVQLVSDFGKGMGARLAGADVPSYADEEKTFAELRARIAKTVAFLEALKKSQFDTAAERAINLKIGGQEMQFTGAQYFVRIGLPNFHFHLTTAYDILRHNGVELGKADYMARV